MIKGIITFDLSEFLDSDDGDMEEAKRALGYVARAKGMAAIAEQTGLGRESLYKTLRPETKPLFDTMLRILHAAGLRLKVEPIVQHSKMPPLNSTGVAGRPSDRCPSGVNL